MAVAGELLVKMVLDGEVYAREMRKIRNANENLERQLTTISNLGGQVLTRGIQALTVAFAGLSYQVVKVGSEFEQTITTLAAIKGVTKDNVSALEEQARLLGRTTAYTATEAAQGMQELARAGMTTNEIMEVSGTALEFAGANAMSMTKSTETLATTFAQFGLQAGAATRVADTFTIAAQNSLFTVEQLAASMKYGGTVGNAYNMSLEETTASLAEFRELGLKGFTAGTQFRQALISLASPTAKAKKVLDEYGLSLDDVNVKLNGFKGVMETLGKSQMDITDITALVSKRAAASITTISQNMAKAALDPTITTKYDELLAKFETGAGRTAETYGQMIDTLQGKFAILKSVYQEALLSVFQVAGPKLESFIEEMTGAMTMLYQMIQRNGEVIGSSIQNLMDSFREALGGVADGQGDIYDRQAAISSAITIGIVKVTNLVASFVRLIPVLYKIAKILVGIFIANKVRLFTIAIAGLSVELIRAISVLRGFGAAAAGAQMALAGPIGAIVGLTVAIGGLVLASRKMNEATKTSTKTQMDHEKIIQEGSKGLANHKRAMDKYAESYANQAFTVQNASGQYEIAGQKLDDVDGSRFEHIKTYLKNNDALDTALKNSIATSQSMLRGKKDEIKQDILAGKLVQVNILQQGKLVNQLMAVDTARRLEATGLIAFNKSSRNTEAVVDDQKQELENLRTAYVSLNQAAGHGVDAFNEVIKQSPILTKLNVKQISSVEELERVQSNLDGTLQVLASRYDHLRKSIKLTDQQIEIDKKLAKETEAAALAAAKAKSSEDWYKRWLSAIKRIEGIEADLRRKLAMSEAETSKKLAVAEDQKVEKIRESYDKALKMTYAYSSNRLKIEKRWTATLNTFYKIQRANRRSAFKDEMRSSALRLQKLGKNEEELRHIEYKQIEKAINAKEKLNANALNNEIDNKWKAIEAQFKTEIAMANKNRRKFKKLEAAAIKKRDDDYLKLDQEQADRSKEIEDEALQERLSAFAEYNKEMKLMADAHVESAMTIAKQATNDLNQLGPLQQLENAKKAALEEARFHKKTSTVRLEIEEQYNKAITATRQKMLNGLTKPYGKYTSEVQRLQRRLSLSLFDIEKDSIDKRIDYLSEKAEIEKELADIRAKMAGSTEEQISNAQAETFNKLKILENQQLSTFDKVYAQLAKGLIGYTDLWLKVSKLLFTRKGWETISKAAKKAFASAVNSTKAFFKSLKNIKFSWSGFASLSKITIESLQKGFKSLIGLTKNLVKVFHIASGAAFAIGKQMASGFSDAVSFLSGGVSLSLKDVLSGGLAAIKESTADIQSQKDELQQMLNDGKMSQEDFNRSIAELEKSTDPAEVGKKYVEEMIASGVAFAQSIIDSAPAILESFANSLPSLLSKVAAAIPVLVKSIADNLPNLISALIDGFINSIDSLVNALVSVLPDLVTNLISVIQEKLPLLIESLSKLALLLIQSLISMLPQLVSAFSAMLPMLFDMATKLIVMLIDQIPSLIDAFLQALPVIITGLLGAVPQLISSIVKAIPLVIKSFIKNLPMIVEALSTGLVSILFSIIEQLPILIDSLIELLPLLLDQLIDAALQFVMAIVNALPELLSALIDMIPSLISAFIQLSPRILTQLLKSIPQIALALVDAIIFELLPAMLPLLGQLTAAIGEGFWKGIKALGRMFWDLLKEIGGFFTLDNPETKTFGDTPEPIKVGPQGMTARFATDDYVIAAKNPMELVRQAYQAVDRDSGGSSAPPSVAPPSGSSAPIDIAIMAEGRLLDAVQVTALNRGHAPKLKQVLRKTSGVKVGFNRGRFNKFTA